MWWRLAGSMDLAALAAKWSAANLQEDWLPTAVTPATALRRAVNELKGERRLVRPLKVADGAAGWAVVQEVQASIDLHHTVELRVTTDLVGRPICNPKDHPDASRIKQAFNVYLECIEAADVGHWLCRIIERIDATPLRESGGVYFVPRTSLPTWRRIVGCLREVSAHVVSSVPAVRGEDAVAAFIDAAVQEARNTCAAIMRELRESEAVSDGASDGHILGERAIQTRLGRLDEAQAKLWRYEELLGVKAGDIHAELEAVQAHGSTLLLKEQSNAAKRSK